MRQEVEWRKKETGKRAAVAVAVVPAQGQLLTLREVT